MYRCLVYKPLRFLLEGGRRDPSARRRATYLRGTGGGCPCSVASDRFFRAVDGPSGTAVAAETPPIGRRPRGHQPAAFDQPLHVPHHGRQSAHEQLYARQTGRGRFESVGQRVVHRLAGQRFDLRT